jgi:hypothetical protein
LQRVDDNHVPFRQNSGLIWSRRARDAPKIYPKGLWFLDRFSLSSDFRSARNQLLNVFFCVGRGDSDPPFFLLVSLHGIGDTMKSDIPTIISQVEYPTAATTLKPRIATNTYGQPLRAIIIHIGTNAVSFDGYPRHPVRIRSPRLTRREHLEPLIRENLVRTSFCEDLNWMQKAERRDLTNIWQVPCFRVVLKYIEVHATSLVRKLLNRFLQTPHVTELVVFCLKKYPLQCQSLKRITQNKYSWVIKV